MAIYRVSYSSMTASYGPGFIEASSEEEARRIFQVRGGFSRSEAGLISARRVSVDDVIREKLDREL